MYEPPQPPAAVIVTPLKDTVVVPPVEPLLVSVPGTPPAPSEYDITPLAYLAKHVGAVVQVDEVWHVLVEGPEIVNPELQVNEASDAVTPAENEASPFTRPLAGALSVGQGFGVHVGAVVHVEDVWHVAVVGLVTV